ncbi:hypothetical protein L484_027312 [Morus notabilis]|uniref:Transcription factor IIIC 90kDa subunit N-terminal domain-containing protein n=1 Tax=Morus notabilis TaxID=981085 RepID=W9QS87_9ROSA|nr:hypothetical protein L484_027312 [Morus notabilis]
MGGDATNWDEDTYREAILKEREIHTRSVFRTLWSPAPNPNNPDSIVVASSDGSLASYSISSISIISELPLGFTNAKAPQRVPTGQPGCFLQAHDGPVYDAKFYGDGEDAL